MPDALFSTLGISPTTDQKAIRRAYAALLKRTDQAGDPEGFAALREAYERARAWAEWQREQDDDAPEPGHSPMETETAAAPPSLDPASAQDESRPTDTPLAGEAAPAWTVSEPAPGPTPEQQAEGVIHWTRTLMQAAADQHTTLLERRCWTSACRAWMPSSNCPPAWRSPSGTSRIGNWRCSRRRLATSAGTR